MIDLKKLDKEIDKVLDETGSHFANNADIIVVIHNPKNKNNMKELIIKDFIPNGYEIDKEKSSFEKIILKKVEKKLPEKWEDIKTVYVYFVSNWSGVYEANGFSATYSSKNTFKTKEQAEASIAMAQLSQLMAEYNNGWIPDWANENQDKYVIYFWEDIIDTSIAQKGQVFLAFKTKELRDKFLKNFRELIKQAKPLL